MIDINSIFTNASLTHGWIFHIGRNTTASKLDTLCNVYCNPSDFLNRSTGRPVVLPCPKSHCYCGHRITLAPTPFPTPKPAIIGDVRKPTPRPTVARVPTPRYTQGNVFDPLYNRNASHKANKCCTDQFQPHCLSCRNKVPAFYICKMYPALKGCSKSKAVCPKYARHVCEKFCGSVSNVYRSDDAYSSLAHECVCVANGRFLSSCIRIEHALDPLPSWMVYLNKKQHAILSNLTHGVIGGVNYSQPSKAIESNANVSQISSNGHSVSSNGSNV